MQISLTIVQSPMNTSHRGAIFAPQILSNKRVFFIERSRQQDALCASHRSIDERISLHAKVCATRNFLCVARSERLISPIADTRRCRTFVQRLLDTTACIQSYVRDSIRQCAPSSRITSSCGASPLVIIISATPACIRFCSNIEPALQLRRPSRA